MSFNFGTNANKPAVPFGQPAAEGTPAATTGFSLGNPAATSTATGLQLKPTTSAAPNLSFGGGTLGTGSTTGFSLPASSATTTGFSLGGTTAGSSAFNLGTAQDMTVSTSAAPGFPATSLPSTSAPTFSGFPLPATTSAATGFPLPGATTSASSGFSLPGATTPASSGFSLSTPTTTSSSLTGGLLLGAATTSAPSTTGTTSFAMPLNLGLSSATTTSSTATTTTASTAGAGGSVSNLNFGQLEETINKWTMDLEEQEKLFMNQATQVNAWDHLLTTNGEKIVQLNEAVEAVKVEQQQIDHELGFILAQQRELEDCLGPLEKELASTAVLDPEREHTYELAETMDTQLKQMSEDLREIIEYLNENNRSQDSSDPLVQIGRILNAHMNSLQWIDQNTAVIQNHLDQVVKLQESHRRDNERSFHASYN